MAEKEKVGLQKYGNVKIPIGTRIPIKLWILPLVDIVAIIAAVMIIMQITNALPLLTWAKVLMYITGVLMTLLAIIVMPRNPLESNFKTFLYSLQYKKDRYYPLDVNINYRKKGDRGREN